MIDMAISKDKVERILTDYYKSKEDMKGIVKKKTTKEQVGYYTCEHTAVETTIEIFGTTTLLDTEIPVKERFHSKSIKAFLKTY